MADVDIIIWIYTCHAPRARARIYAHALIWAPLDDTVRHKINDFVDRGREGCGIDYAKE